MSLELVLIRHAKSLHDEYVRKDIERHLAARGYAEAAETGAWMKKQKFNDPLYVSSPAVRAFTTALIIADVTEYPADKIQLDKRIFDATARGLLKVVQDFKDENKTVLMFGHNPGFTDLLNLLCGPTINDLPTSGVAVISFGINSWAETDEGGGRLNELYVPERK